MASSLTVNLKLQFLLFFLTKIAWIRNSLKRYFKKEYIVCRFSVWNEEIQLVTPGLDVVLPRDPPEVAVLEN